MTIGDSPSCGITYNCNSENSGGVIYNRNIFIIQAINQINQPQLLLHSILLALNILAYLCIVRWLSDICSK